MPETIYTEVDIANGDPVVVQPYDDVAHDPICLGTGFEGIKDLTDQLEYAMDTGESTKNITPGNAHELGEYTNVHIFSLMGEVDI